MNSINKYSVTELNNAIDDAVNVSFGQMIDTIRNQCYMSQTETSWEDCDELEFLEDIPFKFTDGKDMKVMIQNQMKRIVISTLTDSDWVGKNDAMYKPLIDMYTKKLQIEDNEPIEWLSEDELSKRNPNKFRIPNNLPTPSYETEVSRLKKKWNDKK